MVLCTRNYLNSGAIVIAGMIIYMESFTHCNEHYDGALSINIILSDLPIPLKIQHIYDLSIV